jgi:hypothetical protein
MSKLKTAGIKGPWGIVQNAAVCSNQLSRSARLLYAILCSYAGSDIDRSAFPSINTLRDNMGESGKNEFKPASKSAVLKWLNELYESGLIRKTKKKKASGEYVNNTYMVMYVLSNDQGEQYAPKNKFKNEDFIEEGGTLGSTTQESHSTPQSTSSGGGLYSPEYQGSTPQSTLITPSNNTTGVNNNINQPSVDQVALNTEAISKAEKKELMDRYYESVTQELSKKIEVNLPARAQKYIYGTIQREGIDRVLIAIRNYLADPEKISKEYDDIEKLFYNGYMIGRYVAREQNSKVKQRCSKIIEIYSAIAQTDHDPETSFIVDAIINMSKAVNSLETVGMAVIASAYDKFNQEKGNLDIMKVLKSPQLIIKYSGLYNRNQVDRSIKKAAKKNTAPDIRMMSVNEIQQHNWTQYPSSELKKYLSEEQYSEFIQNNYDIPWIVNILTELKESV